jgi:hypothetical protein
MWTIWQWLDPATRQNAISGGGGTYLDSPAIANKTLCDTVDLYYSGGEVKEIRDLRSTFEGDLCYMYV